MDRGAWWAMVCRVAKDGTRLRDLACTQGLLTTIMSLLLLPCFSKGETEVVSQ